MFQSPTAHPFGQNCSPAFLPRGHICWGWRQGFDVPAQGLESEKTLFFL